MSVSLTMISRCLVTSFALAALLGGAWALSYVQDELLWTKQQWNEFKLDFPYSVFKDEGNKLVDVRESPSPSFVDSTLRGPQTDLEHLIEEDIRRDKFQPSSFVVTSLDDNAPREGAVAVVQCKVCLVLVRMLWETLTSWTNRELLEVTADDVAAVATSLCEEEVSVEVLKEWSIQYAQINLQGLPGDMKTRRSGLKDFFLLTKRHRYVATAVEIEATRSACRALIASGTDPTKKGTMSPASALSVAAAAAQMQYLKAVTSRLGPRRAQQQETSYPPGERRPAVQRLCIDRHPQCEFWANLGECTANPNYMVGTTPASGWCRKACRECNVSEPPLPAPWTEPDVAALNATSSELLDSLHSSFCIKAAACQWTESTSARDALVEAAGIDGARTTLLQQAAIVAGPVAHSKEPTKPPPVNGDLLKESIVIKPLRAANDAVIAPGEEKKTAAKDKSPSNEASSQENALWNALGDRCMYLDTGWWSYELCYYGSVIQYHLDPRTEKPDWIISLGHFAAAEWKPSNASDSSLFPAGSIVPYIEHTLVDGNVCMLTGEQGVGVAVQGGGEPIEEDQVGDVVRRSTSLRFMCSPDKHLHMVVTEPKQCRYVVELYMKDLCVETEMVPHHREPVVVETPGEESSVLLGPDYLEGEGTADGDFAEDYGDIYEEEEEEEEDPQVKDEL